MNFKNGELTIYLFFSVQAVNLFVTRMVCFQGIWTPASGEGSYGKFFLKNKKYLQENSAFFFQMKSVHKKAHSRIIRTPADACQTVEVTLNTFCFALKMFFFLINAHIFSNTKKVIQADMQTIKNKKPTSKQNN